MYERRCLNKFLKSEDLGGIRIPRDEVDCCDCVYDPDNNPNCPRYLPVRAYNVDIVEKED